jgi:hypothetical protein
MTCALVGFLVSLGIFSPGSAKRFWRVDVPDRLTKSSEMVDDTIGSDEEVVPNAWAVEAAVGALKVLLGELATEEVAKLEVADVVGVVDEATPAVGTTVEGPVAGLLIVGVRLSAGWVDTVDAVVGEVRRNAANFIRLETRLVGEVLDSFSGSLSMMEVLILEKDELGELI